MAQTCFEDEPYCTCRIHLRWLFLAMATRHCLTNCQQRPSPEGHGRNHVLESSLSLVCSAGSKSGVGSVRHLSQRNMSRSVLLGDLV